MSFCRTAPCADSTCFAGDLSKFGWATEMEKGRKKKVREPEVPKRWPNEFAFEAFNASKSGFLKADCSKLVFKNVLPARAGSIFLQNEKENYLKIAFACEFALAFALKFAFAGSDPILDGSMCENNTFCRAICISKHSGTQRKSAQPSAPHRRATPFSMNLSIHVISSSLLTIRRSP